MKAEAPGYLFHKCRGSRLFYSRWPSKQDGAIVSLLYRKEGGGRGREKETLVVDEEAKFLGGIGIGRVEESRGREKWPGSFARALSFLSLSLLSGAVVVVHSVHSRPQGIR